jgi:hemerythrin
MKKRELKIVEWNERLSTGISAIDLQHRTLLQIINDLLTSSLYGKAIACAYLKATARPTVDYIRRHFATEEILMTETGYPHLVEHQRQHREFIKALLFHVGRLEAGLQVDPVRFVCYLRDWFLTHITITDKKYGIYNGQPTEQKVYDNAAFSASKTKSL